jgi:hypothetical protein
MSGKVCKLVNRCTGLVRCRACGAEHFISVSGERYRRGSWQCQNGCSWEDVKREEKRRSMRLPRSV